VGRDIVDQGLVREEPDARAVAERMAAIMDQPDQRPAVLDKVAAYARTRGGGTALACQAIAGYL
jgi:hypothetical protein